MAQHYDNQFNNLLSQVPLTVSPFVKLPTAPTLSYKYTKLPSVLPSSRYISDSSALPTDANMSSSGPTPSKIPYVTTPGGPAAHPDTIAATCRSLHEHLERSMASADAELRALEERIAQAELAEKRRIAPGWLDSENHILTPQTKDGMIEVASRIAAMDLISEPTAEQKREAEEEAGQVDAFATMLSLKDKQKAGQ
ncbi:hypothetical protein TD95_001302 [Thielaviopsis punctulata]|uniref:Uncharacterized protein n=1 Tax=Thielaviopsis punctulata TaxID=72032 RepID=A0A0F4ZB31_9PEZI|nr:hypothetical protein TD95_001302 [Thielaviopsis punctulata]